MRGLVTASEKWQVAPEAVTLEEGASDVSFTKVPFLPPLHTNKEDILIALIFSYFSI